MGTERRISTSSAPRAIRSTRRTALRSVSARRRERGGALVEFSVALLVLWLLVAATLDLGRAFASSHVLQTAARATARELALSDLAWDARFEDALGAVFDPSYLVVRADCLAQRAEDNGTSSQEELALLLADLPLNRMLTSLMMYERVSVAGTDYELLRYPGALLRTGATSPGDCRTPFTVAVPRVDDGAARIVLEPVVGEADPGAFALDGGAGAGTVGVRLLFPFQAAALSSWELAEDGTGTGRPRLVNETEGYEVDAAVGVVGTVVAELDARGPDGELVAYARRGAGDPIPVYGGSLGLGVQQLLRSEVRPYRRVLEALAFAPREVAGGTP